MWLNDGAGQNGRVLKRETVEMAAKNGLGDMKIKSLPGVIPWLSNEAEFFPGMPKSWGLTFMINDEMAPTGRPAGALAWAGLANLYLLDRPAKRHRRLLGHADPALRGSDLGRRLSRFRNRGLRCYESATGGGLNPKDRMGGYIVGKGQTDRLARVFLNMPSRAVSVLAATRMLTYSTLHERSPA